MTYFLYSLIFLNDNDVTILFVKDLYISV